MFTLSNYCLVYEHQEHTNRCLAYLYRESASNREDHSLAVVVHDDRERSLVYLHMVHREHVVSDNHNAKTFDSVYVNSGASLIQASEMQPPDQWALVQIGQP